MTKDTNKLVVVLRNPLNLIPVKFVCTVGKYIKDQDKVSFMCYAVIGVTKKVFDFYVAEAITSSARTHFLFSPSKKKWICLDTFIPTTLTQMQSTRTFNSDYPKDSFKIAEIEEFVKVVKGLL